MSGAKIIEGLKQAIAGDFGRVTIEGQVWTREPDDAIKVVSDLATHFIVKDGPNKDKNQYGHLELWWAAKSVDEEPSASYNPFMLLASAENSYSLACMGHLAGILEAARKIRNAG
jgi:hypothetical protein